MYEQSSCSTSFWIVSKIRLDVLAREVIRPALEAEKIPWYGWRTSDESSPARRFRQSHPADSASRECDHHDQHLREDGNAGRRRREEAMRKLESKRSLVVPQLPFESAKLEAEAENASACKTLPLEAVRGAYSQKNRA